MWKLLYEKEGKPTDRVYYVLIDKELTVGRKDCDILISGDASVSRKHATLQASHPIGNIRNVDKRPLVTLRDGSSKYGCFLNGKQVGSEGVILTHNDMITFGQCGSNFHVVYKALVVATSCVDSSSKAALKEDVRKLGGHVVDEWTPSCTHLAMTGIKVTVKTVCALICQTPIVQPEYFKMYRECRNTGEEPEEASKFLPPVNEALLDHSSISFHVQPVRKEIFKDKCFVFLSTKQYLKLKLPISLGGGESILLNPRESNVTTKQLLSSCVVDCPVAANSSTSQAESQMCSEKEIEVICTLLRKFKKRLIPESDIGLAVVHCSTEFYCNPDMEPDESTDNVNIQSQTLSQSYMHNIIPETANSFSSPSLRFGETLSQIVTTIPETEQPGTSKNASNSSKSQVVPPDNQSSMVPNKKRSLESSAAVVEGPSPKLLKPDKEAVAEVKEEPLSQPPVFDTPVFTRNGDNQSQVDLQADTQVFSASLFKDETQEYVTEERSGETGNGEVSRQCLDTERQRPNFEDTGTTETVRECGASKKQKRNSQDTCPTENLREGGESKKQKPNSEDIEHRRTSTEPDETKSQRRNSEAMEADSNNGENEEISKSPVTVRKQKRSIDIQVPSGFLHSQKKPLIVTCKEEPGALQEMDIPSNLVVVKMANLIVKNTNRGKLQANAVGANDPSVKNFKRFKKTANAGAHQLPRIIGGNDLLVFQRIEAQADMEWLLEQQETENSQQDLENNTSFNVPIRKRPRV